MSGLRIHHATERNCTLLIHHPGEIKSFLKTKNPGRRPKDYHIRLDNEGNCIVSETIWSRLQEVGANFIILNEVSEPPTQVASFRDSPVDMLAVKREINKAIQDIAPPGIRMYVRQHG